MDFQSNDPIHRPKRLKTLAFNVMYPKKNNLLHQFVLDNSAPNDPGSASYMNAVLVSMSGTSVDVNKFNGEGYSPLHLAVLKNNLLMVQKLLSCLKDIDINLKCNSDFERCTALHFAAKLGHVSIVQELLTKGADANLRNQNGEAVQGSDIWGRTPLHLAAYQGHIEVLRTLLDKGASVQASDTEGCTPLHHAAYEGHIEAIRTLLDKGASVQVSDTEGCTPLHDAAYQGNIEVMRMLLDKGASVQASDKKGWTPLHHAADRGHIEAIRMLLDKGSDKNAKTKYGTSPLQLAKKYNHKSCIEALQCV